MERQLKIQGAEDGHGQQAKQHPRAVWAAAIDHQDCNRSEQPHDAGHDPQAGHAGGRKILISVDRQISSEASREGAEDHTDQR